MAIKLLVVDVDGTLTDGSITHHSDGCESKMFNAHDGLIMKVLPQLGIDIAIITGRDSSVTQDRANYLGVKHCLQGIDDKVTAMRYLGYDLSDVAYIGDDLNDYAAMQLCKFKGCPADAVPEIKGIVDYVSICTGGKGAVRDICEYLLKQLGKREEFLKLFNIHIDKVGQ
jgi:3-deoxy-D-manno-octulosonate 8-phosphate phosphatase (KDO 8-P phosphatase)